MRVRDLTLKVSEYKGRWGEAAYQDCPCRGCMNMHNCSRDPERYYSDPDMRCATRENGHCRPEEHPPEHQFSSARARKCRRCGIYRD